MCNNSEDRQCSCYFEVNGTKIKGGQSGRKVVIHDSKSDLPLISLEIHQDTLEYIIFLVIRLHVGQGFNPLFFLGKKIPRYRNLGTTQSSNNLNIAVITYIIVTISTRCNFSFIMRIRYKICRKKGKEKKSIRIKENKYQANSIYQAAQGDMFRKKIK